MADDGLLLNFAAPPAGAWEAKQVFKGGRWKDRLTAKKSAEYGALKRKERAAQGTDDAAVGAVEDTAVTDESREYKRRRTDTADQPRFIPPRRKEGSATTGPVRGDRDLVVGQYSRSGKKEVVSSLFTYNPASDAASKAAEQKEEEAVDDVEASNAPLSPEMENFVNLGLSRSLAHHLLSKMEIKAPTSIQRKAVSQLVKEDSDAFVQAETGSGKTLAYLLPIVQRLINLSQELKAKTGKKMDRHAGLFAMILAPTRELSKQISAVLEILLGCAHWIVAGTVIGGEKKKSEKARLRKGLNILVATPGRLADHLNNTEVLDVSKVRWLVLDEGDRLMELGFEQDIQKIVATLNLRMRAAQQNEVSDLLPKTRTTVLCSATMKMDVQKLGEISLKDAAHLVADRKEQAGSDETDGDTTFQAPSQLKQSYAVVPAKQRLVTLVAVLRRAFARKGTTMKAIVFLSCADSVDFHFELLTRKPSTDTTTDESNPSAPSTSFPPQTTAPPTLTSANKIPQGGLLPQSLTSAPSPTISHSDQQVHLHRLHGSLPQATRTTTLQTFSRATSPSILICTDVASRGLDLPNIDFVLEYDPPFSRDEHLHRIGRTARAGRDGRAMIFLTPGCEEGYVSVLRQSRREGLSVTRHAGEELLRRGFAATSGVVGGKGQGREWEARATEWQLDAERWVLDSPKALEAARRAYQSHVRAYATHVAAERGMFDIKQLHLGHLAKAFGLRDRPGSIKVPGLRKGGKEVREERGRSARDKARGGEEEVETGQGDVGEAKRKMREKMRAMGGASEFNLG